MTRGETTAATRNRRDIGEDLVKKAFGGALYQQGRGFYVALELFAILRGLVDAGLPVLPTLDRSGPRQPLRYRRRSHDFARRLAADPDALSPEQRKRLAPDAVQTLRALLAGLTVPIPGVRSAPAWWNTHFFPYVGELAHYDAVSRGRENKRISVERYTYRGGGSLAYVLLWEDADTERLARTRQGLSELVGNSDGALGRLARAFAEADSEQPDEEFTDNVAAATTSLTTPWADALRDGVATIVSRSELPSARRIDALMHFVPFCIAMHELACADRILGSSTMRTVVVDCRRGQSPLRKLSREDLNAATSAVFEALSELARRDGQTAMLTGPKAWRDGPRAFFTTTLGTVGALNAMVGQRHFRFAPALTEALVLALVPTEMTYEDFVNDVLHLRLGLVVSGTAAELAGRTTDVDRAWFDENEADWAATLRELGVLQQYSDATRMVGARTR